MGKDARIVRILLVGDANCGKTSIILALVGEEFPLYVPARAEEITIPADVTPEKVPTHIVDYSSREQDEEELKNEITKSHVVCVVYALNDETALDKVTTYWLPLVKSCTAEHQMKPVILAGNKADLSYDMEAHSEKVANLLSEYAEIETGVECSAKELLNVSELFYFAQKAVLHPTAPLYLPNDQELTPACKEALRRIFQISDVNGDSLLEDNELNDFQIRCFNAPLQPQALQDVKSVVAKNLPNGVVNDALTLEGFVFLHQLFVQRGRHETTWKVLRKFGYANDLTFKEEYFHLPFELHADSSVELTASGLNYLTGVFKKYDKDGDGALSSAEQQEMLSICPGYPWDEQLVSVTVETNESGWVTLKGFLAFWILQTSIDHHYTLQFLAMTGYSSIANDNLMSAIEEIQPHDKKKSVFRCKCFGSRRSGKTTLVRGLVRKQKSLKMLEASEDDEEVEAVAIRELPVAGKKAHLILQEAGIVTEQQAVHKTLEQTDVVAILFDTSDRDSFRSAAELHKCFDTITTVHCPYVFVATKTDLPRAEQNYTCQPEEYLNQCQLLPAKQTTVKSTESFDSLYTILLHAARDPSKSVRTSSMIPRWLKYTGIGLTVCVCLGALVYLFSPPRKQPAVAT